MKVGNILIFKQKTRGIKKARALDLFYCKMRKIIYIHKRINQSPEPYITIYEDNSYKNGQRPKNEMLC